MRRENDRRPRGRGGFLFRGSRLRSGCSRRDDEGRRRVLKAS
jgi:hypothetical protein